MIDELARNLMRPVLALYIGGMGSRKQNFYNNLVQRYGFEDAAAEIQDLYLEGKQAEAGDAIPDELIDMVSLCGPRDVVRERLAAFRDAGVGTLMVIADGVRPARTGSSSCAAGRARGLSAPAVGRDAERRRGASRGVRCASSSARSASPGHAFPMLALGARAGRARARGHVRDVGAVARARRGAPGCEFVAAPEYPVFPTRERPLQPYEAVVAGDAPTRAGDRRAPAPTSSCTTS